MNKLKDWVSRLKKGHMLSVIGVFIIIIAVLITVLVRKEQDSKQASENSYNMAFYSLVDYVENVETYLAKSLISSTPEHGAETLTNVWREANLAQSYLARLPIESQELENTEKFLNQVSDYSYSLSRKNIYNESLSDEDLKNLKDLHNYSVELENTLNQLSEDINSGRIKWNELSNKGTVAFAQQVSTQTNDSFSNLEENFHEYSGLIYDGAFSEHITSSEKKGLTGNNIDEETAKNLTQGFAAGIGGSMEATCGAIIGAVSVLGMINKDAVKTMQGSRRIINRFKEQNGTVVCKELKGITDGVVKRECIDCVKDAALFLEDELK